MKLWKPLFILGLAGVVGCAEQAPTTAVPPIALIATATYAPTPTLVPALAPVEPLVPGPTVGVLPPSVNTPPTTTDFATIAPTSAATTEPTVTETATTTATPSLPPEQLIPLSQTAVYEGRYGDAIGYLEATLSQRDQLTAEQISDALYHLGVSYQRDGRYEAARDTFLQLLSFDSPPSATSFYLAQAYQALGDSAAALNAYQTYLQQNSDMAPYIAPIIADLYGQSGDNAAALAAYETAVTLPAHRLTTVANRFQLAHLYEQSGNLAAAIAQYEAIEAIAITQATKGEANYLAGSAELLAGNTEAAYGRYQKGITTYPLAYESYLGLSALVEANVPVDAFQRGLVDYYAKAYEPAIAAFDAYLSQNPETANPEAHLYLARCYKALGNWDAALQALADYGIAQPAAALNEQAELYEQMGQIPQAIATYLTYTLTYTDGADAPTAAWQAAELTENLGDTPKAIALYEQMGTELSWHDAADDALFRAGWLAYETGDGATAVTLWQKTAALFPNREYGQAATLWLLKVLPTLPRDSGTLTTTTQLLETTSQQAQAQTLVTYYALRAKETATGVPAFSDNNGFALPTDEAADQASMEAWLRQWLGLDPSADVRSLDGSLVRDGRFSRGEKLWQIGLWDEAKREFESLRDDVSGSALLSYQLALYFRDIGLYRSSIVAASSVLYAVGQSVFDVPVFLGRLLYPVYYADLILPLADSYGYDPRLQFALIRQESLFEGFARSGAAAQGLSQVIPETGAYIAQKLAWPDYENEDLYLPHVGLNFGAYYLAEQLSAFGGYVPAALAAYNAGPGNASRWYNRPGADSDLDVYVEAIRFPETRLYVERIYLGYVIYRFLYTE